MRVRFSLLSPFSPISVYTYLPWLRSPWSILMVEVTISTSATQQQYHVSHLQVQKLVSLPQGAQESFVVVRRTSE